MLHKNIIYVQMLNIFNSNSVGYLTEEAPLSFFFKQLLLNHLSVLCTFSHYHQNVQYYVHYIHNYSVFWRNSVETRRQNYGKTVVEEFTLWPLTVNVSPFILFID